jgi:RNA polymerase sigma factor (sigma-70 family)
MDKAANMDDAKLLQEYVAHRSETAFAELVARHINLVYSTALRVVGETALARDVAQTVFIQLARKAPLIRSGHALPGWLYRVTRCQAANAVRDELTRRRRETEAMNMNQPEAESAAAWESIAPHLEAAMNTLSAADQNAVVLRFFEGQSWREVARALALREDAAQKRVSRAVEKLRSYFVRRGIGLSAAVIMSVVAANAVSAAPAGLASTVASASLAGAGSFSLLSTLIKTILMKKTAYAMLGVALTAAVTVPILIANAGPSEPPVTEDGLRQGLVLHLSFDQPETDGRTIDASGRDNHGQVAGATWTSDGKHGGAYRFASPNQFIRVANNDSLNPSNITLAAWIKTSRNDDTWRRVFDKSYSAGYAMSIGGGHTPGSKFKGRAVTELGLKANGGKGLTCSDRIVTDGQWHLVATTYNGAEEYFYVDGVRQKSANRWTGRVPANKHDLTIGINLVDPNLKFDEVGASFDGTIDEPMIWSRALSPPEIAFLCESQR